MNKQYLKVGMSFEVVEVLRNIGALDLAGRTGIVTRKDMFTEVICKGAWDYCRKTKQRVALMYDYETKPIGKLTITSLK